MPSNTRSLAPLLRSTISWAIRVVARLMSELSQMTFVNRTSFPASLDGP